MKILKSNVENNYVNFEVEFTSDELKKVETGILTNYARDMKVEGFRKGKAPIEIIKNHIPSEELKYRATNLLAQKNLVSIENSEENQKIDVVVSGEWTYEINKYEPSKSAILTFKFEQYPEVKVGDYKKLELPEFNGEVTQKTVDEELSYLLKSVAKDVPFEKDEKVAKGDLVSINLKMTAEGEKEHKLSKRVFEVKENKSIVDFEKHAVGLKENDKVTYDVVYPENFFIKGFANKKGQIELEILKGYHLIIPELNEEFINSLGMERIKTKDQFLTQFKKDLYQKKLNEYKTENIDKIYSQLVDISEVSFYPELLIQKQANEMIYGYAQELKRRGITLNDYLKAQNLTIEKFQEEMIKEAKKSFLIQNILAFIGEKEDIKVLEEHIENFYFTLAQQEMMTLEEVKKKTDLEKSKSLILNSLIVDKIVELNAKK